MTEPRVLTIVLNYKTAQMTLKAADAARVAMQGLPGEIVIVDNEWFVLCANLAPG